jgi:hypothetical protein
MLTVNGEDISNVAQNLKLKDVWNNGAGVFTFEYPSYGTKMYANGSVVTFQYGTTNVFYGFLFSTEQDNKKYKCTCYDQRRYFKSSNSILRPIGTLTSFVNTVAASVGNRVRLGTIDSTEYKLGKYLFDNKTHLDMIYQSIQDNLVGNGYWYALRDNFGALDLRDIMDLRLPLIIGDGSLATDFNYEKSIDDDTYNYIKVAKDDSKAGVRNTYIAQDSTTIGTDTTGWGKLMYYDKVSADLNDSQLKARCKQLLTLKNRQTQTLTFKNCVGDNRVMGGNGLRIVIAEAGLDIWAVVNSVTHYYKKDSHLMDLEMRFVW